MIPACTKSKSPYAATYPRGIGDCRAFSCHALRVDRRSLSEEPMRLRPANMPAGERINPTRDNPDVSAVRAGFTLLEVIIVIALMSLLLMISLPNLNAFLRFSDLQSDLWRVLSDLRSYRLQAIVEHADYHLFFDPAGNQYTVERRDYLTGTLIKTVKVVKITNDLADGAAITFHPRGNATVEGSLRLHSRRGNETAAITVYAATGAAQVMSP